MMIKNNIWNILLVICSFIWAYLTFSYIDTQNEKKEQENFLKYEQGVITEKSQNLEQVQILSWTEIQSSQILLSDDEERLEELLAYENDDDITDVWETVTTETTVNDTLLSVFSSKKEESNNQNMVDESESSIEDARVFPEALNTSMNFHSQSPFGTWWEIFWETCEEASVLLAYLYFQWITVSATEFRDELLRLVDYQNEVFWDFKHTTVAQTAEILRDYYKYENYEILENPSADDLKYNIAKGSIILAPFYGVGMNPNYSWVGPEYHFMVLKWYTKDTFITHDVGTKRGANYEYPISTIMERIHDYHPESVKLWGKRVIVVSPS